MQRLLSETATIISGGTPSTKKDEFWNGSINWFTPSEIGESTYVYDSERKISELGLKKSSAKLLPKNETILFTSRASIGDTAILKREAATNQGFQSLVTHKNTDVYFLYSMSEKIKKEALRRATGSTFQEVSGNEMKKIEIQVPEYNEQYKIGKLLKSIDKIITLEQKKVEYIKNLYQSLVQLLLVVSTHEEPIIRLNGYTHKWQIFRVSDIFEVTRGNVLAKNRVKQYRTDQYKYPVYSSQTLNDGLMGYYNEFLFEDAITWTTDGANAGTVEYRQGKFYSTNVNGVLISDDGYACKAVAEILNNVAYKYVSHVGNPKLMNNVMADIPIYLPTDTNELMLLSDIFLELEKIINQLLNSVEHYKTIKTSLLNNLFI